MGAPAPTDPADLAASIRTRHAEIAAALAELSDRELRAPSLLPGWSRLTIVCHLRFGAETTSAMVDAALAGRPAAYYPAGRSAQRDATLRPRQGESSSDVVDSFTAASARLDERWSALVPGAWATPVCEPDDNADLGETSIGALAMLRSTEVEVHGLDLDVGVSDWSPTFVSEAFPFRLRWLPTRRSNHRPVGTSIDGRWALVPDDAPMWLVSAHGDDVAVAQVDAPDADVRIEGSERDLLGFLLGRVDLDELRVGGDERLASAFHRAFPAP